MSSAHLYQRIQEKEFANEVFDFLFLLCEKSGTPSAKLSFLHKGEKMRLSAGYDRIYRQFNMFIYREGESTPLFYNVFLGFNGGISCAGDNYHFRMSIPEGFEEVLHAIYVEFEGIKTAERSIKTQTRFSTRAAEVYISELGGA